MLVTKILFLLSQRTFKKGEIKNCAAVLLTLIAEMEDKYHINPFNALMGIAFYEKGVCYSGFEN